MRVPYDLIVLEADKIITSMALANDYESSYHWKKYLLYIDACGWTDFEFDTETMIRIDSSWDQINNKIIWN